MTNRQIAWAAQHDWFLCARDGRVFCVCRVTFSDGRPAEDEFADFDNITDLRAWAGY